MVDGGLRGLRRFLRSSAYPVAGMHILIEHDNQIDVVNWPDKGFTGQASRGDDLEDVGKLLELSSEDVLPPLGQQHVQRVTADRSAKGSEPIV